jgi:hypothetical protein
VKSSSKSASTRTIYDETIYTKEQLAIRKEQRKTSCSDNFSFLSDLCSLCIFRLQIRHTLMSFPRKRESPAKRFVRELARMKQRIKKSLQSKTFDLYS